jgi:hypothetical protein
MSFLERRRMIRPSRGHVNDTDEVRVVAQLQQVLIGSALTRAGNDSGAEFVDQTRSAFGRLLEQQNRDEANRE